MLLRSSAITFVLNMGSTLTWVRVWHVASTRNVEVLRGPLLRLLSLQHAASAVVLLQCPLTLGSLLACVDSGACEVRHPLATLATLKLELEQVLKEALGIWYGNATLGLHKEDVKMLLTDGRWFMVVQ